MSHVAFFSSLDNTNSFLLICIHITHISKTCCVNNVFWLFYFGVTCLLDHCLDYLTVLQLPFSEKCPDVLLRNVLIQSRIHGFFQGSHNFISDFKPLLEIFWQVDCWEVISCWRLLFLLWFSGKWFCNIFFSALSSGISFDHSFILHFWKTLCWKLDGKNKWNDIKQGLFIWVNKPRVMSTDVNTVRLVYTGLRWSNIRFDLIRLVRP